MEKTKLSEIKPGAGKKNEAESLHIFLDVSSNPEDVEQANKISRLM